MSFDPARPILPLVLGAALVFSTSGAWAQGAARDGSMKACGDKWQAAKAANATQGATWPKFLAECRAAAQPAAAVAALAPAAPAPVAAKAEAAKTTPEPVFPAAIPAKFAELRPAQARQKTCSEQYQANKAANGNGGLRWLEKGGGYWSLCNRKLKGG